MTYDNARECISDILDNRGCPEPRTRGHQWPLGDITLVITRGLEALIRGADGRTLAGLPLRTHNDIVTFMAQIRDDDDIIRD